ncbi:McrB family protein [Streptomyces milbemycinicus]|uniref:McrB family protein n=1 Tax=Streptomyces milbemycinicus TaxID=476552 RepID=UPI0033E2FEFF
MDAVPTVTTIAARALHTAFVILDKEARQDGLEFRDLWARVLAAEPRLEADWEQAVEESPQENSTPLPRYVGRTAIQVVKAGWLFRGNRRWQLTGLGQQALREWPDAVDFFGQAGRRYRVWNAGKARYAEALEALAKLPDSGGWVRLEGLAHAFEVQENILAGVLRGDRPAGWYLALGPGGEAGAGYPLLPHETDTWRTLLAGEGLLDEGRSSADTVRALPHAAITGTNVRVLTEQDGGLADEPPDGKLPRQLWIVRGVDASTGAPLIRGPWRDGSVITLDNVFRSPEVFPAGPDRIRKAVDTALPTTSPSRREIVADELDAFLNRMRKGDIVLSMDGYETYVGVVRGHVRNSAERLERPVEWRNLNKPLDFLKDLPSGLSGVVQDADSAVFEATEYAETVVALIGDMPTAAPVPQGPAQLPDATDELAARLHLSDTTWLQDCVELLRASPQLIFHGPPGTGKTFIALELARHLAGASSATNVRLVQFHPAYAYEDFFEGIRPRLGRQGDKDGGLGYDLHRGPLRRLADEAERRPAEVFVLVIDEINRGHLAKIFGELYFLLEYRTERVHLLYGSDDGRGFRLPPNLYIIGTMNTVDRSVAYMDAAMRRRFSFLELHPDIPPVSGILGSWLARRAEGRREGPAAFDDSYVRLLGEVNRLLAESSPGDRSFRVGPSYFMQDLAHTGDGAVERLWRTQIIPLLTEHHWGDGTDVEAVYGLDTLRDRLGLLPPSGDVSGPADS